jgi:hypothetical protein
MKALRVQRMTEQTEVGLPDEVMHRLGLVEGQRILADRDAVWAGAAAR